MAAKRKARSSQLSLLSARASGRAATPTTLSPLKVAGLFAGVGGLELGFHLAGHQTTLLVESMPEARAVLRERFAGVPLLEDVRELTADALPAGVDVISAGFPCQDLSSVGLKEGILGSRSGLIGEVLRLLRDRPVPWLILENVPFLLDLSRGKALQLITQRLQELGYSWAYRVLDAEAFGLPQRRRRWFLVASNVHDPRSVLLSGNVLRPIPPPHDQVACGFYWTEGMRALGWAVDAVPPIKAGSTVGVPSPPAILLPGGRGVVTPDIRDAERLQGFPVDWTKPAESVARQSLRWRLVGNAVCVPVSRWIAERVGRGASYDDSFDAPLLEGARWPSAAWCLGDGRVHEADCGEHPVWFGHESLEAFLLFPGKPLSVRAAAGFLARANKGSLRFAAGLIEQMRAIATSPSGEGFATGARRVSGAAEVMLP